ncbi:MAG: hypothetical protein IPI44_02160 [Sulfuritalea sp.]|nr:hypothetical protein [Sulfuritalea sp.]
MNQVIGNDQRHPAARYWRVLDEPFGPRRIAVPMQAHARSSPCRQES